MNSDNLILLLPSSSFEERSFIQTLLVEKSEEEKMTFITQYIIQRKDPQQILLFTLVGFVGIAGIQRVILDEILIGLLYFFTGGFCFIGTIVDLIRYKELTFEYNKKMANLVYHSVFR